MLSQVGGPVRMLLQNQTASLKPDIKVYGDECGCVRRDDGECGCLEDVVARQDTGTPSRAGAEVRPESSPVAWSHQVCASKVRGEPFPAFWGKSIAGRLDRSEPPCSRRSISGSVESLASYPILVDEALFLTAEGRLGDLRRRLHPGQYDVDCPGGGTCPMPSAPPERSRDLGILH